MSRPGSGGGRTERRGRLATLRAEHGYVAALTVIMMPVFIALAAFAVDAGQWWVTSIRVQNAADAAALAGVVYLPGAEGTAFSEAQRLATVNGYENGVDDAVVVPEVVTDQPTRLEVTISDEVRNTFAGYLGIPTTRITRNSVADYAGPLPMGSPCNVFGNQLMQGTSALTAPNCSAQAGSFWVNVAGRATNKARGDAYSSGWCGSRDNGFSLANCSTDQLAAFGNNEEYVGRYFFGVEVRGGGTLDLQVYDAGHIGVGDKCRQSPNDVVNAVNPYVENRAVQYIANETTGTCPGDVNYGSLNGDNTELSTTYRLYAPSPVPFNPTAGPLICSWTLPGIAQGSNANLRQRLTAGNGAYQNWAALTYRRWATVCPSQDPGNVTGTAGPLAVTPGLYVLEVDTTPKGGGQNRFAIRANLSGAGNGEVSIYGLGRVSFYNNVPAGTSQFYLTRLDSSAANRTLRVRFFDLADAAQPVNVTLRAPDSSTGTGIVAEQEFPSCTFSVSGTGNSVSKPSSCTVQTVIARTGAQWVTADIPLPANYRCNSTDPSRCWVTVRLATTADQNDTTTWTAELLGDPVRLVE
jgi:Flp pilus assembly protein TadG